MASIPGRSRWCPAESDEVVGGIPGHLLCMKGGTLLPNAGVDASNAPPGCVVLLPADPGRSACTIREEMLPGPVHRWE